jgi:hypothetical protein
MNYAVHSASAVAFPCRRPSLGASTFGKLVGTGLPSAERRITINVGGERFQTYENTLARYPDSLLGSPERRQEFYDASRNELVFPARNKNVFNAILFFYQAEILSRPIDVPLDVFLEEIKFFDLLRYSSEVPAPVFKAEYVPSNTARLRVWNFMENPHTKKGNLFATFNLFLVFIWLFILCLETGAGRSETERNGTKLGSNNRLNTSQFKSEEPDQINEQLWRNISTAAPTIAPDSDSGYKGWKSKAWFILDTTFVIWFTVDYLLHITCEPSLRSYILSPLGIIDLVTILPYYVALVTHLSGAEILRQMGLLRFLRVFRLFKATRYSSAFRILLGSLTTSAKEFPVWFILMFMHIVFFSSILYYAESEVNNPQFSNIPDVMYFTIITMCAVGYGDAVPQSALCKFVTSLAAISGIVIVYCIPAPTLKTNFNRLNELHKSEKKEREKLKENGGELHKSNHEARNGNSS